MDSQLTYIRLSLSAATIVSIIYFYSRDIIGYSPKSRCFRFVPISCRKFTFIVFALLTILELATFGKIGTSVSYIIQKIPKYYYLALMFIIPYLMGMIYLTKEPIEKSDDFHAFPQYGLKRKTRPKLLLLIIIMIIVSLALEAYNLFQVDPLNANLEKALSAITSHPNKTLAFLSKARLLQLPLLVMMYHIHKNYTSCIYDLPSNWNY